MATRRAVAPLILALLFVAVGWSCTTYTPVPNDDWPRIESGTLLRVTTRLGELHVLVVERIDDELVRGNGIELAFDDIALIERHSRSPSGREVVLITVITLVTVVALVGLVAASVSHTFGP